MLLISIFDLFLSVKSINNIILINIIYTFTLLNFI